MAAQEVITSTKKWIQEVVIGLNFCPFASREVNRDAVHYQVEERELATAWRQTLLNEFKRLDRDRNIATTLIIFPNAFPAFEDYLKFVQTAQQLLIQKKYKGIYQLATFHPLYRFEDAAPDDPANFTNRSIYPMLHLLREDQLRRALRFVPDADQIPERNILLSREKGAAFLQALRESCMPGR